MMGSVFGVQRPNVYRDHALRAFADSQFEIIVGCPLFFGTICIDHSQVEQSSVLDTGTVVLPIGVFVEVENPRSVPYERLRGGASPSGKA